MALALVALGGIGHQTQVHRIAARRLQHWLDRSRAKQTSMTRQNSLPTLHLDLDSDEYRALALQRHGAYQAGILLPGDIEPVAAQIRFEGQETPARVRLAGSEPDGAHPLDHWQASKWSLEVEPQKGTLLDMPAFALLSPALRQYLNGWLYAEDLRGAGLPAPRYRFVNLTLNGEDWGIYVAEERLPREHTPPILPSQDLGAELRGRYLAHADLWAARRGETEYDRQAYNSSSIARPEPVWSVAGPLASRDAPIAGWSPYDDPTVAEAYAREVERITRPKYLAELQKAHRRAFNRYSDALAQEFFPAYLAAPWDALAERQQMMLAAQQTGVIKTRDSSPANAQTPPAKQHSFKPPPAVSNLPPAPTVEEALARHPFLRISDRPSTLEIKPGTWHVEGDMLLPEGIGLRATGATTLTFEQDAVLLVRGPLELDGGEGNGIHLLPERDHWGGLLVYGAGEENGSTLRNVEIRGTRGIQRSDWTIPAGVTFYQSPVATYGCRVLDAYGPAAIEITDTPFDLVYSEFGATSSDALRVDHGRGRIERCAFHDVLGEAVRLAGSKVEVVNVTLQRISGEALSGRRDSVIQARGIRARDIGIAVAGADGSSIYVRDARVGKAHTAAFAAYRQDLEYGQANVEATEIIFEDDSRHALVQEGNRVTIDSIPAETQPLDADDLRPQPEPSPPMHALQVRFGPSIWLVGYELTTPELAAGETVEVILYWRTFAPLDRQYTVFMHVRDASGEWVAGWDMMPRYNTYPTTDWPVAERIDDAHILPLPQDLPPGEYTIALGMYYWGTGERLPAYTRQGGPIPEAAVVLEDKVIVK
jgi:hypothetical protein